LAGEEKAEEVEEHERKGWRRKKIKKTEEGKEDEYESRCRRKEDIEKEEYEH